MSSFNIGRTQPVGIVRQLAEQQVGKREQAAAPKKETAGPDGGVSVQTGVSVGAGQAPVEQQRVSEIREAIERGTYPVIPTRIADAMIAARLLLSASS